MYRRSFHIAPLTGFFFLLHLIAASQICQTRFSTINYRSISFDSFTNAIATSNGSLVAAGNIYRDHAFVAKFTSKGTPQFSWQYQPVYHLDKVFMKNITYLDLINTKDGGVLLAGTGLQDKYIGDNEYLDDIGIILKLDTYGNVQWSKKFDNVYSINGSGHNLAATSVIETRSGDIIFYLAADFDKNYYSYGKVVCLDSKGNKKWISHLSTRDYDGSGEGKMRKRALMETANGSIVLGDAVYQSDRSGPYSARPRHAFLHFLSLDAQTGKVKWETGYKCDDQMAATGIDITSVTELGGGRLAFTSALVFPSTNFAGSKKGVRIVTSAEGVIEKATAYYFDDGSNTSFRSATKDPINSNATYFLQAQDNVMLVNMKQDGSVVWTRSYGDDGGNFPVNCVAPNGKGYALFCASLNSWYMRALLTDTSGVTSCAPGTARLLTENFQLAFDSVITDTKILDPNTFGIGNFDLTLINNPLQHEAACTDQPDCCTEKVDSLSVPEIRICEGQTFRLTDNTVVRQTGTYFVANTTAGGCDSIVFYRIVVDKDPSKLTLGPDICINGRDSIQLSATGGYDKYSWMGNVATTDSFFTIRRTGLYKVRVQNSCGARSDTIEVLQDCDYPIFMPNAFSPNGDGLNDVFRVPLQNKNRLVSLRIYDRWGQLVFQTTDGMKGWDGKAGDQSLPNGTYIYYLVMEGLSGNRTSRNGTLVLMR